MSNVRTYFDGDSRLAWLSLFECFLSLTHIILPTCLQNRALIRMVIPFVGYSQHRVKVVVPPFLPWHPGEWESPCPAPLAGKVSPPVISLSLSPCASSAMYSYHWTLWDGYCEQATSDQQPAVSQSHRYIPPPWGYRFMEIIVEIETKWGWVELVRRWYLTYMS